ncbi:hypothetical protein [Myroides odoratus]
MNKISILIVGGMLLLILIYAFLTSQYNPLFLLLLGPSLLAISKGTKKK